VGLPSLALSLSSFFLSLPLPFLTEVRGYNPGDVFLKLKVLVSEF